MMADGKELHDDDESTWSKVMMMVVKDMLVHDERKNCHEELGAILPSTMRAHKRLMMPGRVCTRSTKKEVARGGGLGPFPPAPNPTLGTEKGILDEAIQTRGRGQGC